jgi:hypothetical protein
MVKTNLWAAAQAQAALAPHADSAQIKSNIALKKIGKSMDLS